MPSDESAPIQNSTAHRSISQRLAFSTVAIVGIVLAVACLTHGFSAFGSSHNFQWSLLSGGIALVVVAIVLLAFLEWKKVDFAYQPPPAGRLTRKLVGLVALLTVIGLLLCIAGISGLLVA